MLSWLSEKLVTQSSHKRIKELIEIGFLVRVEVRKGGKFAGYNYHLNDTATGKTGAGKTAAVFTAAVNPQQSNTNIYTNITPSRSF